MKKPILPSEIAIAFQPSKFLWGWLVFFSILVVMIIAYYLPLVWAMGLLVVYAAYVAWAYTQCVGIRIDSSIQTLRVDVFGQLSVTDYIGRVWTAEVLPDSIVHPFCLVIHLAYRDDVSSARVESAEDEGLLTAMQQRLRPRRLLILPDHADAESLRALRIWLRWGLRY